MQDATKHVFGVVSINFHAYKIKGDMFQFYGIVSPTYDSLSPMLSASQEIQVVKKNFTDPEFLGLSE